MSNAHYRLAIVGKGAIGSLVAFRCHELDFPYQILIRTLSTASLTIEDAQGDRFNISPDISPITQPSPFDLVILPVKAHQVMEALSQLKPAILPHHIIVLLHNGMGIIEQVQEIFPDNPCIASTTSYGAYKIGLDELKITGSGPTNLGWVKYPDKDVQGRVEKQLSALLPPSNWHADIKLSLWKKLAINASINPLTALNNIKNGKLADKHYELLIIQICREITEVMQALSYSITPVHLIKEVKHVIRATANNYSSMHQDMAHQRPTEIDSINGYVVQKAKELGLHTPLNQQLLTQIQHAENRTN